MHKASEVARSPTSCGAMASTTFEDLPLDAVMDALARYGATIEPRPRLNAVKVLSRVAGVCTAWRTAVDAKAKNLLPAAVRPVAEMKPCHALWFAQVCTGLCGACGGDAASFNCIPCSGSGCASDTVAITACGSLEWPAKLHAVYTDQSPTPARDCSVSLINGHVSDGSTILICRHSITTVHRPRFAGRHGNAFTLSDFLSDYSDSSPDDEDAPAMWSIAPNLSPSYPQPNFSRIYYTNPSESMRVPVTGWCVQPRGGSTPPPTLIYVWCDQFMWPRPPPAKRAHEALNCHVPDYYS